MDATDRRIINGLQGGFPVCDRPYAEAARALDIDEDTLIGRLGRLMEDGKLSRFGPLYHAERIGGALTLAAMSVPEAEFDDVADIVNGFPEVAHNYAREHALNMWFVLATERPERIAQVITEIEAAAGHKVYDMPRIEEFYVGLRVEA